MEIFFSASSIGVSLIKEVEAAAAVFGHVAGLSRQDGHWRAEVIDDKGLQTVRIVPAMSGLDALSYLSEVREVIGEIAVAQFRKDWNAARIVFTACGRSWYLGVNRQDILWLKNQLEAWPHR